MMNVALPRRRAARGFTLIELMITVTIIAILASIAYPAYNQSVRKSRRADAKTALLDLAQREERFMSTANTYSKKPTDLGYPTGTIFPMNILTGGASYYTLDFPQDPDTMTFTITATPTGDQLKDKCGAFTLKQDGTQTVNNTTGTAASDCW
jgi:type IV pilus assembly protein PilE